MSGPASCDAAAVGTTNQNEWHAIDCTHHEQMLELGILDRFVSPAIELASKKGVRAREKLRQHRREHNGREIRKALHANPLQSTLQQHVRAPPLVGGMKERKAAVFVLLSLTATCIMPAGQPAMRSDRDLQGSCGTASTHV
jgi:hypothetical protein